VLVFPDGQEIVAFPPPGPVAMSISRARSMLSANSVL
jgi:hypothetical protein